MVVYKCTEVLNEEVLRWRWAAPLGTCIYNTYDEIGIVFGIAAMIIWTFALLPQIILNYMNGTAENQSFTFWFLWTLGDVLNVTGCLLANEIITNTGLALVYFFFTVIAFAQFLYYNYCKVYPKSENLLPEIQVPFNISPRYLSPQRRKISYGAIKKISAAGFACVTLYSTIGEETSTLLRRRLMSEQATTGVWLGWIMAVIYVVSRLPQIYLLLQTKETAGISALFFTLTCLGNFTQFMAMIMKEPQFMTMEYFLRNLPWLGQCFLCMCEDFVVIALVLYVRKHHKTHQVDKDEENVYLTNKKA